ncbi:MAG: spore germination protein [Bacillota bacterium]
MDKTLPYGAAYKWEWQALKPISVVLEENRLALESTLGNSSDVTFREFRLGMTGTRALLAYVEGIVDLTTLIEGTIKPLTVLAPRQTWTALPFWRKSRLFALVRDVATCNSEVTEHMTLDSVVQKILEGDTALFLDGCNRALTVSTKGWKDRQVQEPETEVVVRGPRDGFTETLRTNTALIRRRIRDPNLRMDKCVLGTRTKTDVSVVYVEGLVNPSLLAEVKKRLTRIHIDGILDSGYLEELIECNPFSLFPTVNHTERPDRVVAALLEGRVAILTDGSPFALIVPSLFSDFLTTNEDYYERYFFASLARPIRYLAFFTSLLLPAVYVAATTFHQEMIPTKLLITFMRARQGIPFPALVEAILMELTFEALREAGVRMPRAVGQAVSVVGAVVIGEAAVRAGIVSAPMVIVVSLTAVTSFAVPSYTLSLAARWLRFPFLLIAATLGLFGVTIATLVLLVRLCALRSFGLPYLFPYSPLSWKSMKDALVRAPQWAMGSRPRLLAQQNQTREAPNMRPRPPKVRRRPT